MVSYLLRRLGIASATVAVTSFVIFAALSAIPGDPVTFLTQGARISQTERDAIAHEFGLDQPFFVRYGDWLGRVLRGDFGYSVSYNQEVGHLLESRLTVTALLVAMAFLWVVILGVGAGVVSGVKRGSIDAALTTAATVGIALPAFVAAVVLITIFSVQLEWFPSQGTGTGAGDRIHHLVLPSIALAVGAIGHVSRTTRSAVQAAAGGEHVEAAIGRGLPRATAVRRHVIRNALSPITTVVGISLGTLIVQTVIVESAFGINGLGSLLVESVLHKDLGVVQAISLLFIVSVVAINMIADVLMRLLDPRVGLVRD